MYPKHFTPPCIGLWTGVRPAAGGGVGGRGKVAAVGQGRGSAGEAVRQLVVPAREVSRVVLEEPRVLADDRLHRPRQAGRHRHVHRVRHTLAVPYLNKGSN